jgi:actin-related protein
MQDMQRDIVNTVLEQIPAKQDAKRGAKEDTRQQLLNNEHNITDNTPNSWLATNQLVKAKQAAVNTMIKMSAITKKKVVPRVTDKVRNDVPFLKNRTNKKTKKRATNTMKDKKDTPKKKQKSTTVQDGTTNASNKLVEQTSKLCGCRHGDLSAFKSFTRAEATYYTRPNKFLMGKGCLDCKLPVEKMRRAAMCLQAVVFYCDQGIKGFDAPDDDPMKRELVCDLVLCPQCEAARRIEFESVNDGQRSYRGGKRSRQQSTA